ncbi:hypothetical protein AURDEDRAFT_163380 [Auricularia subglabra TFB-10046 SS5]|nr:hypothetical protein AURDEDRAFT_163380 [Auricularia subglabra TFB-10046 SS5]
MSLVSALAVQLGDAAGQNELRTMLGLYNLLVEAVDRVRVNRQAALALSQRISEMLDAVRWIGEQDGSECIASSLVAVHGALQGAQDAISAIGQNSYLSQLLHQQRDKEAIVNVVERVDATFKVLMMELRLHAGEMAHALTSQLDALLQDRVDDIQRLAAPPPSPASIPPNPQIHFGRLQELSTIVEIITNAGAPGRIAILGGPGMGKTSLAVSVLHHPEVEGRFGKSRHFVSCDAAEGGSNALRLLAEAFGAAPADQKAAQKRIREALELPDKPSLLVLDNFESAWEGEAQRQDAEQLLQFLDSLQGLALMITLRGTERPQGIAWSRPFLAPLAVLSDEAAKQTFLAIADVADEGPAVESLLGNLDNVPLALVLMANLAQSEAPALLLQRWKEMQTTMLARGTGDTKSTSLDVSIQLSLQSPRMQAVPAAQALLAILSLLPCGAIDTDVALWGVEDIARALAVLLRTSLASRVDERIYVLAPIRSFVIAHCPPADTVLLPVYKHFFSLADIVDKSTAHGFDHSVFAAVVPELANIDAVVRHALKYSDGEREAAVRAAARLCNLHAKTCVGPGLELLPLALQVARQEKFGKLQAELVYRWAFLAFNGAMPGDPATLYRESQELYELAGDVEGTMIASISLIRFLPPQEAVSEGRRLYRLAEKRGHFEDMARSCYEIGIALHRDGKPREGIAEHELAITLLGRIVQPGNHNRLVGTNQYQIAEFYRALNDMGSAVSAYRAALATFKAVNFPHGVNVIYTQLADTFLFQGWICDAVDQASCALAVENVEGFRNNMRALLILAHAHAMSGNHEAAFAAIVRLAEFEPSDGPSVFEQCKILRTRGIMALYRGDLEEARVILRAGRTIARRRDAIESPEYMLAAEASILVYLSEVEYASGNAVEASNLAIRTAVLFRAMSRNADTPHSLVLLAEAVDDELAGNLLGAVMLPLLRLGARGGLAIALLRSATIASRQGNVNLAASRAQTAIAYFGDIKDPRRLGIAQHLLRRPYECSTPQFGVD